MYDFFSVEMKSCIKGEQVLFTFSGFKEMYLGLLTEAEYKEYKENMNSVQRKRCQSGTIGKITSDGVWYAVFDLNGTQMKAIETHAIRFSPSFSQQEIQSATPAADESYVFNAEDTPSDGVMIDHWKKHQHKNSTINLENKTFKCPSCGKTVKTEELHGAHVLKVLGHDNKLYITPTCNTCNTNKNNRIFKVKTIDLVVAPPLKK